jgi:hypothetical protein
MWCGKALSAMEVFSLLERRTAISLLAQVRIEARRYPAVVCWLVAVECSCSCGGRFLSRFPSFCSKDNNS